MSLISARKIIAARALLDWTQGDLAHHCKLVSLSTIRAIEKGKIPRDSTIDAIRETFLCKGVEFTADGVKYCINDVRSYKGSDACDKFFAEIESVVRTDANDVLVAVKTESILTRKCGNDHINNISRLAHIQKYVDVKCVLIDIAKPSFVMPPFPCRAAHTALFNTEAFIIYDDKFALIMSDGHYDFRITVFDSPVQAKQDREAYVKAWATSVPVRF